MIREEKSIEAAVHFELYRLFKNNMDRSNSVDVQYISVKPELSVKTGSVDLMIEARRANGKVPLLAVEVKKHTRRSGLLYEEASEKQIKRYAKELQSPYSALTDGQVLRFFAFNQTDGAFTHIGDYNIQLDDDQISLFLTDLLRIYENKQKTLSLSEAPPYSREQLEREIFGLTKTLRNLFEQIGQEDGFRLEEPKPNKRYIEHSLSFNSFKDVLNLSLEREKREASKDTSYVLLNLSDLRDKLGREKLRELLAKLSQIPSFNWINPDKAETDLKYTWKNLRDITTKEDPKPKELKKQLKEWFLELAKIPKD